MATKLNTKTKGYFWLVVVAIAAIILITVAVRLNNKSQSSSIKIENNISVSRHQKIDSAFFGVGQTVNIAGTINGDVYVAGQTVTVSGTVNGDVLAAGQVVNINGNVAGDIRVAGQIVNVNGNISRSATIIGQTVSLDQKSAIGTDLVASANSVTLNGYIRRDVTIGGNSLVVAGNVGRNLGSYITSLTLGSDSRIGGNINYTSQNNLIKQSGATVDGNISRQEPIQTKPAVSPGAIIIDIVWSILALSIIVVAASFLIPRWLEVVTRQALPAPWRALLVGLVAIAIAPITFLLLLISVIGVPLAVIGLLVWLVLVLVGYIFFAYYLGRLVFYKNGQTPLATGLTGGLVAALILHIPIINVFMVLIGGCLGTGMLLLEFKARRPYRYNYENATKNK